MKRKDQKSCTTQITQKQTSGELVVRLWTGLSWLGIGYTCVNS